MPSRNVTDLTFTSWPNFRDAVLGPRFRSWAFRGQADASWPLHSTLSRYFADFGVHPNAWVEQEKRILRIFKRKAHVMLQHLPHELNTLEWLALMQHHGAPTRLLDFSWSPLVATFFALERATKDAAVWAIHPPTLAPKGPKQEPWLPGVFEEHFLPNTQTFAVVGEPSNMNQRLTAQLGTFVIPAVVGLPIEEFLPKAKVFKLVLKGRKLRDEGMRDLYNMNLGNATLFPGLDGLARSMAYELEFHWAFNPKTMKQTPGFPAKRHKG